ncbi:MAG: FG-GAP-like repeat-containing protein, partial [Patescibacteria group bacterium]
MKKHFQKLTMIVIVSVSWFGQAYAATMEVTGADSTNSVTLSWTAPADDGDVIESGPCAVYDLRFARDSITQLNWHLATPVVGEPVPTTPGTDQVMLVTGLTPATRYYWGLKAADETYYLPEAEANPDTVNWSELSNVVMRGTMHSALYAEQFTAFVGDFNADGKCDLALYGINPNDVYVALRSPDGTYFIPSNVPWIEEWVGLNNVNFQGDFNGDGRTDLLSYSL